jgi:hypothetical protein
MAHICGHGKSTPPILYESFFLTQRGNDLLPIKPTLFEAILIILEFIK